MFTGVLQRQEFMGWRFRQTPVQTPAFTYVVEGPAFLFVNAAKLAAFMTEMPAITLKINLVT